MQNGYKVDFKMKYSPLQSQVKTTHSSPNLMTQLSQFTNVMEDDIKLNDIRRMRSQQQENVIMMQSRLNHLMKLRNTGQSNINIKQQDINNIIQRKTRVFVDRQYKLYVNQIQKQEQKGLAQEVLISRQRKYNNYTNTFQYTQMQLQSLMLNNRQEKQARKQQLMQSNQEIYDKNLITHSLVKEQFTNLQQFNKASFNVKRAVSAYNYRHKVQIEKNHIEKIMLNLQQMEKQEQNVIFDLRATQNNERNIQEQKSYVEQEPVEHIIGEKERRFFQKQRFY